MTAHAFVLHSMGPWATPPRDVTAACCSCAAWSVAFDVDEIQDELGTLHAHDWPRVHTYLQDRHRAHAEGRADLHERSQRDAAFYG